MDEPIAGSHLITSCGFTFDDYFTSATDRTSTVFHGGCTIRQVGNGYIPSIENPISEQTGTIDTLNCPNSYDPKGLTEEGMNESINEQDGISIPSSRNRPTTLRRITRTITAPENFTLHKKYSLISS